MGLAEKPAARIQNVNNLPCPGAVIGDNIGTKYPGMPAGKAIRSFAADLDGGYLNLSFRVGFQASMFAG